MGIILSVVLFLWGRARSVNHDVTRDQDWKHSDRPESNVSYACEACGTLFACRGIGSENFLIQALDDMLRANA